MLETSLHGDGLNEPFGSFAENADFGIILLPLEIEPPIVQGRMTCEVANGRRGTARRSATLDGQASRSLIISLLKGETTAVEAARRHGLKVAEVEGWRDRFLLGAENALRARQKEDEGLREEEINRLKRKVGELTMDLDILREAARRPTTPGTSDE